MYTYAYIFRIICSCLWALNILSRLSWVLSQFWRLSLLHLPHGHLSTHNFLFHPYSSCLRYPSHRTCNVNHNLVIFPWSISKTFFIHPISKVYQTIPKNAPRKAPHRICIGLCTPRWCRETETIKLQEMKTRNTKTFKTFEQDNWKKSHKDRCMAKNIENAACSLGIPGPSR